MFGLFKKKDNGNAGSQGEKGPGCPASAPPCPCGTGPWSGWRSGQSAPGPRPPAPGPSGLRPPPRVYAATGPGKTPEYGQPIYWYDIHLTNRNIVHTGVNQVVALGAGDRPGLLPLAAGVSVVFLF